MQNTVEGRLKKILIDGMHYAVEPENIRADTSLYGRGLGLDSLDIVTLVVRLEEEFDIFLEAEEVASAVDKFGSLLEAVEGKVLENGSIISRTEAC